ncbi:MAG: Spy/CpxP family protein refolding chaperone [Porticoccaceae bacterium]|nr:Spy/CpxP family protein refolding chaperone [Porticoccaceae bacterium]
MNALATLCTAAIKSSLVFFTVILLFSASVNAAQIPDPAVSQKTSIDQMHHKLHDDQASFKATETQTLKDLNEMAIREDITLDEINAKIDELMAAKVGIMRLRYAHLVEMRKILSDEQKVGYDKALLKRTAVK